MNPNNNKKRLSYLSPIVKSILLDNEISLILSSSPPEGPEESDVSMLPACLNNDPFKHLT